jgi:hypothetical protein
MKRLLIRVYVVGSILFFLGITVFFFFGLSESRKENVVRAGVAFQGLSDTALETWRSTPLPEAGDLFTEALSRSGAIQPLVVSIYSFDVGIDYLWAVDHRFLNAPIDGAVAEPPVIQSNEIVHRRFSRTFELPSGERRIITAVYPVLDETSVYPVLRLVLLAVLAFLVVVLVITIATAVAGRSTRPSLSEAARDERDSEGKDSYEKSSDEKARSEDADATREVPPAAAVSEPAVSTTSGSGLVPEASLMRRLSLELERAAFHEQDLSIAIFRFSNGFLGDEQHRRNARATIAFFSFEDLCFELGEKEAVVIFPATPLQDALGQIERFQRFYWEERMNWETPGADFIVGASARNGRLVDGERVLMEAKTALRKAEDSTSRIIGFQPDPQRYRSYLLDQSR